MKCPNCDTSLKEGAKFCKHCGHKIGGHKIEKEGQKETKNEQKESSNEIPKDTSSEPNKENKQNIKEKIREIWNSLNWFEKSLIVFALVVILALLVAIIGKRRGSMAVAILQLTGLTVTFLIEKGKINVPKNWIKYVIFATCLVLACLYLAFFPTKSLTTSNTDHIVWDDLVLGDTLPKAPTNKGKIYSNSDENLDLYLYNISSKQFYKYIESCKQKGFDIDSDKQEYSYTAFAKKGYKLEILYLETSKEMNVKVSVQDELEKLNWSDSNLAKLLPVSTSKVGKIIEDTDKKYQVLLGTTLQEFSEYVSLCKNSGFQIDEDTKEKSFTARNEQGNKLEIEYLGNSVIKLTLTEPEYKINIKIDFDENWIFSTYDVKLYIDDSYQDTLDHGKNKEYERYLSKGEHTLRFENDEDSSITGEMKIEVSESETINLNIHCYNNKVTVKNNEEKQETPSLPQEEEKKEEKPNDKESSSTSVSYSTNDSKTVRNGNSGVYAYKRYGNREYDMYYIIDFDQGYVYYFTEGTIGSETCDRLRITSGDLNSVLIITYHDGESVWQEGLHFKYKNHPERLILEDNDHFEYEYNTTNLNDALRIRDQKRIVDY